MQDDQLFFREDLCHFPDRDEEKKPAEAARADGDRVRPIAAGCVPHFLDETDPALRCVDTKALAASKPVVDVRSKAPRTSCADSHRTSFRLDWLLAQSRSRSAKSGLPSLNDYFSLWRRQPIPTPGRPPKI
jgi:hypothetical protein